MNRLIYALFFVSGATALIGEVVWMRILGLVLGNTVWAASAAVAVWMGGMAVGALVAARVAPTVRRHLRWYGLAEAGIGVFFLLSTAMLAPLLALSSLLGPDLGRTLVTGVALRLAVATLALAVPTVLMGLTLPLLVERLRGSGLAAKVSLLYGLNTLGAAAGVFVSAYALLPWLGESGSLTVAGLLCLAVAVVALALEPTVPPSAPVAASTAPAGDRAYLVLAAAMGFSALAAELVWVRILVLHLGSRVYAFALLLGVYLIGLSLGSLLTRVAASRIHDPRSTLARIQVVTAVTLAAQVMALGYTSPILMWVSAVLQPSLSFASLQAVTILGVVIVFLPVTMLFGASFPLAVAAEPRRRGDGSSTGVVMSANTIGAIAGTLVGPFILVPLIGSQRLLFALALVHAAVGLALRPKRRFAVVVVAVAVGIVAVASSMPPDWVLQQAARDDDTPSAVVEIKESLASTVLVKRYGVPDASWLSLEVNGVNVAGSSPSLLAIQQLQGNLPLLQNRAAERVLHIGFGSGGTCWAVSRHPVREIDVVEISPEVLDASHRHFQFINHGVLGDPRVRQIINDGRNYLWAINDTYDIILSDSIHPVFAGNGALYTVEYFRLCRQRLAPGGVVSMWLPLYSLDEESFLRILAAFAEVFPHTLVWYDVSTVNEFTVVTGAVEPGPIRIDWAAFAEPGVAASLAGGGVHDPGDLMADLLLGPDEVRRLVSGVPVHADDLPWVEYHSGRTQHREGTWLANLLLVASARSPAPPFADPPSSVAAAVAHRDKRLRLIADVVASAAHQEAGRVD